MNDWNGEGLPPIGCECEACWLEAPDGGSRDFEMVRVKGIYSDKVWISHNNEDLVFALPFIEFRQLKPVDPRRAVLEDLFKFGSASRWAWPNHGEESERYKEDRINAALEKLDDLPPF